MADEIHAALAALLSGLDDRHRAIPPRASVETLTRGLDWVDPSRPIGLVEAIERVRGGLATSARTSDARYLGLPHASPIAASVVADLIAAAENPELATFEHAPFAVLAEQRAADLVAERLGIGGYAGRFTSGGAESNLSAVLVALAAKCPRWRERGVRALAREPVIYASNEAHPTVTRAARIAGLGEDCVRGISVDGAGRMSTESLADALGKDVAAGRSPLLIVATSGTTATGAFDPLPALATLAAGCGAHLHVDAAWGGMLAFGTARPAALEGLGEADSVAFDPHKALFAPLGTGLFFARSREALAATFSQDAPYLPRDDARDPRSHGLAWSRRFVGLRVLLPLATEGWQGFAARIDAMLALGERLARRLTDEGMRLRPRSPLPVVAFTGPGAEQDTARWATEAARHVEHELGARIAIGRSPSGDRFLRAAIVSRHTLEQDVDDVARTLGELARR